MSRDEGRLLCIGDVHGCRPELERLLEAIDPAPGDRIVFLGDYVDRGHESAAAVALLLALSRRCRTVFLRGNHEEMLLAFLGFGGRGGSIFVRAGGAATLLSYGVDPDAPGSLEEELRARMPGEHLAFFRDSLEMSYASGPWMFVHAGVRPGRPLARQSRDDLLWIREDFLEADDHGLPATVLYGHTPGRDVVFSPARRIGMDTGCVYGGRLSALDLTARRLHQIRRDDRTVRVRDVAAKIDRTL